MKKKIKHLWLIFIGADKKRNVNSSFFSFISTNKNVFFHNFFDDKIIFGWVSCEMTVNVIKVAKILRFFNEREKCNVRFKPKNNKIFTFWMCKMRKHHSMSNFSHSFSRKVFFLMEIVAHTRLVWNDNNQIEKTQRFFCCNCIKLRTKKKSFGSVCSKWFSSAQQHKLNLIIYACTAAMNNFRLQIKLKSV